MRRTKLYLFVVSLLAALASSRAAEAQLSDTEWVKPMMMLLVDTSGSMERRIDEAGQPTDRLPDCTGPQATRRNRWANVVEALTGSFVNSSGVDKFTCTPEDRVDTASNHKYKGAFDENYFLRHYNLEPAFANQTTDGILDIYKDNAKFGLMTFDGVATTVTGDTLVPYLNYPGNKASIDAQPGMFSYPAEVTAAASTSSDTPQGQFGWKPLAFPGCTVQYGYGVNAGVLSADSTNTTVTETGGRAGGMISIGLDESSTAINAINDKIQTSLRYVRPYGGTPIAAMLDDFRYYLKNNNDVKQGSDPFFQCRRRYAVLLTDGAPDSMWRGSRGSPFWCEGPGGVINHPTCPEITPGVRRCQCPYDKEENIAASLINNDGLEKLWVVAFNVDSAALTQLNQIAQAGSKLGSKSDALTANTGGELTAAMAQVMALARPESTSRSVPVVINTGRPVTLRGAQYVITAGFQVGAKETDPWQGRLFRQRVECNGAVPTSQDLTQSKGDLFHLTLNGRESGGGATRNLKTVALATIGNKNGNLYAGPSISPVTSTVNLIRAVVSGVLDSLSLTELTTLLFGLTAPASEYSVSLTDFTKTLSPLNFDTIDTTRRDLIIDYTRGADLAAYKSANLIQFDGAARKNAKLADIYRSNPAVIPPLALGSDYLNAFDPSLRSYYLNFATKSGTSRYGDGGRPGVVFVGTNDGVLHAFNLDDWTDKSGTQYAAGHEFWGFVPPALFSKMYTGTQGHTTLFDGSPVVKDVILSRSGATSTMGTVLVSAVRGANAYIAMDVTYPESPSFLWQRTFQTLGETVATPAIAQVKVNFSNVEQTRAVAILPGGRGTTSSTSAGCDVDQYSRGAVPNGGRAKVRCWNTVGRGLWVVDVATGALIQEFDSRHFPSPMTGSVVVDGQELGLTRAAYMTDEDGVLWRLSMMNSDPSKWRIAPIWDLYAGSLPNWLGIPTAVTAPIWSAGRVATRPPVLLRDPKTANLTIIVGTGDIDYLTDSRPNRVVSLQEVRKVDGTGELIETGSGTLKLNWGIQLDGYESVTGPISVLDDVAYFTTFKGPSDSSKCLVGGARIVGAAARTAQSNGLPLGMMTPENSVDPTAPKVLSYTPSAAPSALLLGLNVSPDPVCAAGTTTSDPLVSGTNLRIDNITSVSRGNYQLRTMVAGTGGTVMAGSSSGGAGAQRQVTRSIPSPNVARSVGWASSIE